MGQKTTLIATVGAGCIALVGGGLVALSPWGQQMIQSLQQSQGLFFPSQEGGQENNVSSLEPVAANDPLIPLLDQPAKQRYQGLVAIAEENNGLSSYRARYLLAVDVIAQKKPEQALIWLKDLENNYEVLASHISVLRLKALEQLGTPDINQQWKQLLASQDQSLVKILSANYALRQEKTEFWDRIIFPEKFTADRSDSDDNPGSKTSEFVNRTSVKQHPITIAVVKERIKSEPNNPALLRHLVNYAPDDPNIGTYLVNLETLHSDHLTPEDWEAIGSIYWRKFQYRQAGEAYSKATQNPRNAYRAGRGLQLGGKKDAAITAYRKAIQRFPSASETGEAQIKLARLISPQARIDLLKQTIKQFPHLAGEVIALQATAFEELGSQQTASQLRQTLFNNYGDSEAAASRRWQQAWTAAKANQIGNAIQNVQALVNQARNSELAPRAGYWLGKWQAKVNNPEGAKQAYQLVLKNYPESYYAWRSAFQLGLPVGDFSTVRQLRPQTKIPAMRLPLPIGGAALQELYQLHQDEAAWAEWVAVRNQRSPSILEQFTDGVMRLGIGDNLNGIFLISNLAWRDLPEEKAEYEKLKATDAYWSALYSLPYAKEIEAAAQKRNFHPLLVAGLIRQESRFERNIESVAGALGLMQVLPTTGEWGAKEIGLGEFDKKSR